MTAPLLHLGSCSWTAKGWLGTVYPKGTKQADYLTHYARRWNSVEIDATFYATPPADTVARWRDLVPEGFSFAAKMPQLITHEKRLENCFADVDHFLHSMARLGPKLGPLLFQFPYFAQKDHFTLTDFLDRLQPLLAFLPTDDLRFAVEVRNKTWLCPPLLDLLRNHGVALALIDHPWMPPPSQLFRQPGIVTAPFAYVRWLGDRHGIERITKTWSAPVVDRHADLSHWIPPLADLLERGLPVHGYVNNHYSGHAPADLAILGAALAEYADTPRAQDSPAADDRETP
jgi:uncharacterized protein YecE (DUF72 family)